MSGDDWLARRHLIGMVHLPPLPGSPRHESWETVCRRAVDDAERLVSAGFPALMVENYGDVPFFPGRVPRETVAFLTAIAVDLRSRFPNTRLGINVLRNDGVSALAIAAAAEADCIRVNVLTGARLTDQGIVSGIAHDLLRLRRQLGPSIRLLADVAVKHSSPLADSDLVDDVHDLVERGLADGVIVSGSGTGKQPDLTELQTVKSASSVPVLVGSGATIDNLPQLARHADGVIVGSAIKKQGDPRCEVDAAKAQRFVEAWKEVAGKPGNDQEGRKA